jgi:hypothetical protein
MQMQIPPNIRMNRISTAAFPSIRRFHAALVQDVHDEILTMLIYAPLFPRPFNSD